MIFMKIIITIIYLKMTKIGVIIIIKIIFNNNINIEIKTKNYQNFVNK